MMLRGSLLISFLLLFEALCFLCAGQDKQLNPGDSSLVQLSYGAYDAVRPPKLDISALEKPVIIAVVDDAFRLTHKDFQGFLYENPKDKTANLIDDDGNKKIDDIIGWDIADRDNDVKPPEGLEGSFYHGTYISSSIITVLKMCFGDKASEMVKILPVKVLSDYSVLPDYSSGYMGIEYAIEQKADIICCAWSGGQATVEQKDIIRKALDQGILVIGSAGNAYSPKIDPPGSLPGVLTVGGIDSLMRKTPSSNYGSGIDLVAPAQNVKAAYPLADNSYFYGDGTSGAAGIVSGCAAVLKIMNLDLDHKGIKDALINTARPVENFNQSYSGKLGAGVPDLSSAVKFVTEWGERSDYFLTERPEGKVFVGGDIRAAHWDLAPGGAYLGFSLTMDNLKRASDRSRLSFYSFDSLWYSTDLDNFPGEVFIPGSEVRIEYERKKAARRSSFELSYEVIPIDSTTMFCRDTRHYQLPQAVISDGSGPENYANNSSCKWQITAPEGENIRLEFEEFHTQAGIDYVYLFDGESTIPENLLARFSGPDIPINITSRSNKVLVWFVTDKSITDSGWILGYHFVDKTPGP